MKNDRFPLSPYFLISLIRILRVFLVFPPLSSAPSARLFFQCPLPSRRRQCRLAATTLQLRLFFNFLREIMNRDVLDLVHEKECVPLWCN